VALSTNSTFFICPYYCRIFIVRQTQEKFRAKGKKLYFGLVDLEKAFDRVPREVIRWAMRKLGVEEWIGSHVYVYLCKKSCKNSFL